VRRPSPERGRVLRARERQFRSRIAASAGALVWSAIAVGMIVLGAIAIGVIAIGMIAIGLIAIRMAVVRTISADIVVTGVTAVIVAGTRENHIGMLAAGTVANIAIGKAVGMAAGISARIAAIRIVAVLVTAAPAVPSITAAPAVAMAVTVAAPIPAWAVPRVVVPAIPVAAEEVDIELGEPDVAGRGGLRGLRIADREHASRRNRGAKRSRQKSASDVRHGFGSFREPILKEPVFSTASISDCGTMATGYRAGVVRRALSVHDAQDFNHATPARFLKLSRIDHDEAAHYGDPPPTLACIVEGNPSHTGAGEWREQARRTEHF